MTRHYRYILPNAVTTLGLGFGFLAILWAAEGRFVTAAWCVVGAAICDAADGRVARLTNATSAFGMQLDSLSDVVCFGLAPAGLMYFWLYADKGPLGALVCFAYLACGAYRLARFNVTASRPEDEVKDKDFCGLPIPAAALTLAGLVLITHATPQHTAQLVLAKSGLSLLALLAWLMVSRYRYASFKDAAFVRAHPYISSVVVVGLAAMLIKSPALTGLPVMLLYVASGPVLTHLAPVSGAASEAACELGEGEALPKDGPLG